MSIQSTAQTDLELLNERIAGVKEVAARLIADGKAGEVSSEDIAESLYVAARLFSAKTDRDGKTDWFVGTDALNATETVVLVTALLEAADVNLFDMAIWYRRV